MSKELAPTGGDVAHKSKDDLAAVERAKFETMPRRPVAKLEVTENGTKISFGDGTDAGEKLDGMLLYNTLATRSDPFVTDAMRRVISALSLTGDEAANSDKVGAALALIGGIDPRNEMESTMALQMVAANEAAMKFLAGANRAETIDQAAALTSMGTKAMRAFALHAETLAKLRRNGEQVVKHVHVNDGGQAIIAGSFHHGHGGCDG